MKLNQDSISINLVVKTKTDKYHVAPGVEETSLSHIQQLIEGGAFTAEFILPVFTSNSRPTLIITENE